MTMSDIIRHTPRFVQPAADLGWDRNVGNPGPAASGISIRDILHALWRRKFRFAAIFAALLLPAAYVIANLPSVYTADAMLVLRMREPHFEELDSARGPSTLSAEANMDLIRSEIQIFTSKELAKQVVLDMHLDKPADQVDEPSIMQAAIAYLRRVTGWQKPAVASTAEQQLENAVKNYRQQLSAFNDGKSFVISVSYSAKDPIMAKEILADHIRFYLADQIAEKETTLDSVHSWLEVELARLSAEVQASEQQLLQFRGTHNLLRSGGETVASHELDDLVTQLSRARTDLFVKQARLHDIQSVGHGNADTTVLASPTIQKSREQEGELSAKLAELGNMYGADNPKIRSAAAALAAARASVAAEVSRMAKAAQNDVNVASSNVTALQKEVNDLSQAASASELTDLSKAQLQRETDADRQLYGDLLRRSKQIEIQRKVQQEPDARVASTSAASFTPSSPHRTILLAISAGFFAMLSGGVTLFLDRSRFHSRSLLEIEAVCRIPGLTSVPNARSLRSRRAFPRLPDPRSVFALSLQTLRNSLAFYAGGIQPQVVAFTSALPGEGKTFLAAFYAQSLAESGMKVLLVDGDLRQSRLTELLNIKLDEGIDHVPADSADLNLDQCVYRVEKGHFDVLLLARGMANPQTMLGSPAFSRLIDKARGRYDFIIFDTPPIAAVDDALPLAKLADATVLIIRWGQTSHDVVRGTIKRLSLGGGRVTGAVLNAVDMAEYQSSSRDLEAFRPLRSSYIRHER